MDYRPLGATGIQVSSISFGAGPVPELMTGGDARRQREAVARAIELGINWIDTAAGYGEGKSEASLGAALEELAQPADVHIATKVRLYEGDLTDIPAAVERSLHASLTRLRRDHVTLVQLHNSVTPRRGDEPHSITPLDVLREGGILDALRRLKQQGLIKNLGLTGIGHPPSLREVIDSGEFATIQIPYHLLNPSAGQPMPPEFPETDFGNLIDHCQRRRVGVFAIRAFAGGALLGQPPSRHTHRTPYFPLPLYLRDQEHAAAIARCLNGHLNLKEAALRFVLSHPGVSSAIIGFGQVQHVEEVVQLASAGPLSSSVLDELCSLVELIRQGALATPEVTA
jgi:aryl-alcohol dehydrogenase-like predicted oxidoreductase